MTSLRVGAGRWSKLAAINRPLSRVAAICRDLQPDLIVFEAGWTPYYWLLLAKAPWATFAHRVSLAQR